MADATTYVKQYLAVVSDPLTAEKLTQWLADDAVFEGYGNSRAEIQKAVQADLDNGLVAHNPIGVAAAGEFAVAIAELVNADGTKVIIPGLAHFNEDDRVTEIVTAEPSPQPAIAVGAVEAYLRVVEGFNRGDLLPMSQVLTEDCVFPGVGNNKAEILKGMQQARDDGWTTHRVLGTATGGEWLVTVYKNTFTDGHSIIGAGIQRYTADGLCNLIVGREPGPVGTVTSGG